jgi:hypothetical protein
MSFLSKVLFSKSSDQSSSFAINQNSSSSCSDEKISVFDPILGEMKLVVGNKSLYVSRSKQLLSSKKISVWELNRPLDENHVKRIAESLETEYKETGQITVFGSLGVFREDDIYKIFDGQHRLEALKLLLEKFPSLNPELTVEVYETKNPIDLFTKLNQIKPQEEKTSPDSRKEKLVKLIQARFMDRVRNQQRTNRPRVTLKMLMDTISMSEFSDESPQEIMNHLETINAQLAGFDMEKLFGKEFDKDPEFCNRIYGEASKTDFYLGLRKPKNSRLDWK